MLCVIFDRCSGGGRHGLGVKCEMKKESTHLSETRALRKKCRETLIALEISTVLGTS